LVPGADSVRSAHDRAVEIEEQIDLVLPDTVVSIHIEPLEDPRAWDDIPRGAEHPMRYSQTRFGDRDIPG